MGRKLAGVLAFVAVVSVIGSGAAPADDAGTRIVAFYDPDANHKAILRIRSLFNEFLREAAGDWTFQPVQDLAAFERVLRDERTAFAVVTASYLKDASTTGLRPILVPSAGGEVRFRKLLVDTGRGDGRSLRGKRIAATGTSGDAATASAAILATLRSEGLATDGVIPLPVSKDIDALLAVSFGQADVALVTPTSIEVLERINPAAARSLRVVFETRPSLRPPLCEIPDRLTAPERERLLTAMRGMEQHEAGRRAMMTLGFDDWVAFEKGMLP